MSFRKLIAGISTLILTARLAVAGATVMVGTNTSLLSSPSNLWSANTVTTNAMLVSVSNLLQTQNTVVSNETVRLSGVASTNRTVISNEAVRLYGVGLTNLYAASNEAVRLSGVQTTNLMAASNESVRLAGEAYTNAVLSALAVSNESIRLHGVGITNTTTASNELIRLIGIANTNETASSNEAVRLYGVGLTNLYAVSNETIRLSGVQGTNLTSVSNVLVLAATAISNEMVRVDGLNLTNINNTMDGIISTQQVLPHVIDQYRIYWTNTPAPVAVNVNLIGTYTNTGLPSASGDPVYCNENIYYMWYTNAPTAGWKADEIMFSGTYGYEHLPLGTSITGRWEGASEAGAGVWCAQVYSPFAGDLVPDIDKLRSLGSSTKRWLELYVSGDSIYMGTNKISVTNNALALNDAALVRTNEDRNINLRGGFEVGGTNIINSISASSNLFAGWGNHATNFYLKGTGVYCLVYLDANSNAVVLPLGGAGTYLRSLGTNTAPYWTGISATATNVGMGDLTNAVASNRVAIGAGTGLTHIAASDFVALYGVSPSQAVLVNGDNAMMADLLMGSNTTQHSILGVKAIGFYTNDTTVKYIDLENINLIDAGSDWKLNGTNIANQSWVASYVESLTNAATIAQATNDAIADATNKAGFYSRSQDSNVQAIVTAVGNSQVVTRVMADGLTISNNILWTGKVGFASIGTIAPSNNADYLHVSRTGAVISAATGAAVQASRVWTNGLVGTELDPVWTTESNRFIGVIGSGALANGPVSTVIWTSELLQDASEFPSIDWNKRVAYGTDGTTTQINWNARQLWDSGAIVLDWSTRDLLGGWTIGSTNVIAALGGKVSLAATNVIAWYDPAPVTGVYPIAKLFGTNTLKGLYGACGQGHVWLDVGRLTNALGAFMASTNSILLSTTNAQITYSLGIVPERWLAVNITNAATVTSNLNFTVPVIPQ